MHLLWAYLERGWETEYDWRGREPSFEAVVRHFKAVNPPAFVRRAAAEIRCLLTQPLGERLLAEIVQRDFCVACDPQRSGLTYRQWLEAVVAVLDETPESPPPSEVDVLPARLKL